MRERKLPPARSFPDDKEWIREFNAGLQSRWQGPSHQCHLPVCISRKPETGAALGTRSKHSNMGQGYLNHRLQLQGQCPPKKNVTNRSPHCPNRTCAPCVLRTGFYTAGRSHIIRGRTRPSTSRQLNAASSLGDRQPAEPRLGTPTSTRGQLHRTGQRASDDPGTERQHSPRREADCPAAKPHRDSATQHPPGLATTGLTPPPADPRRP